MRCFLLLMLLTFAVESAAQPVSTGAAAPAPTGAVVVSGSGEPDGSGAPSAGPAAAPPDGSAPAVDAAAAAASQAGSGEPAASGASAAGSGSGEGDDLSGSAAAAARIPEVAWVIGPGHEARIGALLDGAGGVDTVVDGLSFARVTIEQSTIRFVLVARGGGALSGDVGEIVATPAEEIVDGSAGATVRRSMSFALDVRNPSGDPAVQARLEQGVASIVAADTGGFYHRVSSLRTGLHSGGASDGAAGATRYIMIGAGVVAFLVLAGLWIRAGEKDAPNSPAAPNDAAPSAGNAGASPETDASTVGGAGHRTEDSDAASGASVANDEEIKG